MYAWIFRKHFVWKSRCNNCRLQATDRKKHNKRLCVFLLGIFSNANRITSVLPENSKGKAGYCFSILQIFWRKSWTQATTHFIHGWQAPTSPVKNVSSMPTRNQPTNKPGNPKQSTSSSDENSQRKDEGQAENVTSVDLDAFSVAESGYSQRVEIN